MCEWSNIWPFGSVQSYIELSASLHSVIRRSSAISIQIFDARKFKTRDQGFLGVVNMKGSDAVDYALGEHGTSSMSLILIPLNDPIFR